MLCFHEQCLESCIMDRPKCSVITLVENAAGATNESLARVSCRGPVCVLCPASASTFGFVMATCVLGGPGYL